MTGKKAVVTGTLVPVVMTRTDIGKNTPRRTSRLCQRRQIRPDSISTQGFVVSSWEGDAP